MNLPLQNIWAAAKQQQSALVEFTRQIVSIPSLPGHEGDVAAVIANHMKQLDYDEVWTDQVGNVIGEIAGGPGPAIILNGHMDHVDTGPADGWPHPPFSGKIAEDELWGRASVDMKGPVACMLYAAALFKQLKLTPPGDVYVTVAVMEEIGGVGTQYLASRLKAQAAICGEPSSNILRRGHRGRVELRVKFEGRSAHASVPHLGVNPHYATAAFLAALSSLEMGQDELGQSSVAPTLYSTDQSSPNVIPGRVYLTLDWRNVPGESPQEIVTKTQTLLDSCLTNLGGNHTGTVAIASKRFTTYTGLEKDVPAIFPSFVLPENNKFVQAAHAALVDALGRDDGVDIWRFATDGGHLVTAGIPTVGFGPGNETLAHTNQERISLAQMNEAVVAYVALTLALAEAAK